MKTAWIDDRQTHRRHEQQSSVRGSGRTRQARSAKRSRDSVLGAEQLVPKLIARVSSCRIEFTRIDLQQRWT